MSAMWRYCRCCYSAENLESLCNPALDAYIPFCNPEDHENDVTQLAVCYQCREFLKEVHHFRIECNPADKISYNNLDARPYEFESVLSNSIEGNSSRIVVKTEIKDEFDIQNNEVKVDSHSEGLKKSEGFPESLLVPRIGRNDDQLHNLVYTNESNQLIELQDSHPNEHVEVMITNHNKVRKKRGSNTKKIGDEKPFSCDQCDYRCKQKGHLVSHKNIHIENRIKPYKCSECSYETATSSHLRSHFTLKHSDERPFCCDICDYRCKIKDYLSIHMRSHLNDSDKPFKCTECSYVTTTKRFLKEHIACKHSDEKPFACDQCNHRCKLKTQLIKHRKIHSKDRSRPYKCSECSYATTTMWNLKSHATLRHSNETPFECNECGHRAKRKDQLSTHIKKHLIDSGRTYECSECSYKTTNIGYLKSHVARKHCAERPFPCNLCNYRSKTKHTLSVHMTSHLNDDSKAYQCKECPYKAKTSGCLKRHASVEHSDKMQFSCDQCNYGTNLKSYLVSHKKIHLKDCDKPYKCSECPYTTTKNRNLKNHAAKKHSDLKI